LASIANALGDQEGIGVVAFGQGTKVLAKGLDQLRIEGIDLRREGSQGGIVLERTGEMPPQQPSGFEANAQLVNLIEAAKTRQFGTQNRGTRLAIGDAPARAWLFSISKQETH